MPSKEQMTTWLQTRKKSIETITPKPKPGPKLGPKPGPSKSTTKPTTKQRAPELEPEPRQEDINNAKDNNKSKGNNNDNLLTKPEDNLNDNKDEFEVPDNEQLSPRQKGNSQSNWC